MITTDSSGSCCSHFDIMWPRHVTSYWEVFFVASVLSINCAEVFDPCKPVLQAVLLNVYHLKRLFLYNGSTIFTKAQSALRSLFWWLIFIPFSHPPAPLFCLWPSLFAPRTGWGDHTCGAEEFARVQTAFGAKATQETDAAGHPGRQGRRAARRLQGDDRDTLAADIKAF